MEELEGYRWGAKYVWQTWLPLMKASKIIQEGGELPEELKKIKVPMFPELELCMDQVVKTVQKFVPLAFGENATMIAIITDDEMQNIRFIDDEHILNGWFPEYRKFKGTGEDREWVEEANQILRTGDLDKLAEFVRKKCDEETGWVSPWVKIARTKLFTDLGDAYESSEGDIIKHGVAFMKAFLGGIQKKNVSFYSPSIIWQHLFQDIIQIDFDELAPIIEQTLPMLSGLLPLLGGVGATGILILDETRKDVLMGLILEIKEGKLRIENPETEKLREALVSEDLKEIGNKFKELFNLGGATLITWDVIENMLKPVIEVAGGVEGKIENPEKLISTLARSAIANLSKIVMIPENPMLEDMTKMFTPRVYDMLIRLIAGDGVSILTVITDNECKEPKAVIAMKMKGEDIHYIKSLPKDEFKEAFQGDLKKGLRKAMKIAEEKFGEEDAPYYIGFAVDLGLMRTFAPMMNVLPQLLSNVDLTAFDPNAMINMVPTMLPMVTPMIKNILDSGKIAMVPNLIPMLEMTFEVDPKILGDIMRRVLL